MSEPLLSTQELDPPVTQRSLEPMRPVVADPRPPEPVRTAGPLGWLLVLATSLLLPLATWNLYPEDAEGMNAGFRDLGIALALFFACCLLRCDIRRAPWLSLTGIGGAVLVLEAAFVRAGAAITTCEMMAGVVVLVGTALQLAQDRAGYRDHESRRS